MRTFIQDENLKKMIEKSIIFYILRKTIKEERFENIKFNDFCKLIKNRSLLDVITGKMGSGKSTLMHILGALDHPTEGSVSLEGRVISKMSDFQLSMMRRRRIGFIFQTFNLVLTIVMIQISKHYPMVD